MIRTPDRQYELPEWSEQINDTIGWFLVENPPEKTEIDFVFYRTRGVVPDSNIPNVEEVKEAIRTMLFAVAPPEHSVYWYPDERKERGLDTIEESKRKAEEWYASWHQS
jgi:hypothetical protein